MCQHELEIVLVWSLVVNLVVFSFRSFFLRASTVDDAETYFSVDEYTDVVTLTKPTIYISVKEIISTHSVRLPVVHGRMLQGYIN